MSEAKGIEAIGPILDQEIRPYLAGHGGNIAVESFDDGVLSVKMLGGCTGCPSASLEVEEMLTEALISVKEIRKVRVSTDVSDELWQQAKALMKHRSKV
jgi:Fe/S biogenesis protein NfuA